jgi:mannose-6-phosphate isomerase-like protein (cupin superfamily)
MAETSTRPLDGSQVPMDDPTRESRNYQPRQKLRTKGWQVVSIPEVVQTRNRERSYFQLTDNRYAKAVMNVYAPGQRDEMHCHPGSEHLFMVVRGELHIVGLHPEENVVLKQGEFIHINQSYYYQLFNETDEELVLYQVATKPAKPPKVNIYQYRGPNDIDPRSLEGQ